jgi:hypothetical protein
MADRSRNAPTRVFEGAIAPPLRFFLTSAPALPACGRSPCPRQA